MRKWFKFTGLALLLAIMCVGLLAATASAWSWKQKSERISGVAGETLATGSAVCMLSDGKVYKADADNATARPAIGVIGDKAGAAGDTVEIVTRGVIAGAGSANTVGSRLYLQAEPGVFNSTAPTTGGNQTIGVALPGGDALIAPTLPMQGTGF